MKREEIQQLIDEINRLKSALILNEKQLLSKDEQLLLKDEQLSLKDEQIERKNERILYLERQLFGRRSEKRLPDNLTGQLSLFDAMHGNARRKTRLYQSLKKSPKKPSNVANTKNPKRAPKNEVIKYRLTLSVKKPL